MKRLGTYLLVFLLLDLLLSGLIYARYNELSQQRLDINQAEQQAAYDGILESTHRLTELTFRKLVDTPQVRALLRQGLAADETTRNQARGRLYRALYPLYRDLQAYHVRQIHVHLNNGRSFLRMHRPDRYGDDVFAYRQLLEQVNRAREPMTGFETGRLFHGFRFVYPIMTGDTYLGAIEFSMSFTAIRQEMERVTALEDTHYQFIVRQEGVVPKLFPEMETLYVPSRLNPHYVFEDPLSTLRNEPSTHTLPPVIQRLDERLAKSRRVQQQMARQQAFGVFATQGGRGYAVNFLPIDDAAGQHAGFIVAYTPDSTHAQMVNSSWTFWLTGSLMIALVLFIHDRLQRSQNYMRTIAEHLGAGLYVMDRQGIITYANAAAAEILGYPSSTLKGANAHRLFHAHHLEDDDEDQCPIRNLTLAGELYASDDEIFRSGDGRLIPVEVISTPLERGGRLNATVTIFRDISERKRNEEKLRQVATAFRNTDEGMMITDRHAVILDVNDACCRITGFSREELLGQTPRLLRSDRHKPSFYRAMWDSINQNGNWRGEIWNKRKNGEIYPEWLNISVIRDERGKVTHYVGVFSDISDIREAQDELEKLAHQDPLTGLANRTMFTDRLRHAVQQARRQGRRVALLFLDLDRFKAVNDTLGHPVGDQLLQEVARRMQANLREEDTLARLGGDEFVILLEGLPHMEMAAGVAKKLIAEIGQPYCLNRQQIYIGTSIGISFYPDDASDGTTLLRNADTAMYHAKEQGRNTFHFYSAELTSRVYERMELENQLRQGLEKDEFFLVYQPQVDLQSGRICGVEALVRWQNPQRGLVSPARFIPVAEESGLIGRLGHWVMLEACRQAMQWQTDGLPPVTLSINLSPYQLAQRDLLQQVDEILAQTGLPARRLELEVTESALMQEPESAIQALNALKSRGIALAIDDFGTGYSSLSYLKQLPIDRLKIDKSFVNDIPEDNDNRAIVEAILAMAYSLKLATIAEGVETRQQLDFLRSQGCEAFQGYYFAKPLPAGNIAGLLSEQNCLHD